MKKAILFILLCPVLLGCSKSNIKKHLTGEWDYAYEVREKTEDGSWGPWYTINTYVLIPGITFTANGELYRGGYVPEGCCEFRKYSLKGDVIKLEDMVSCPTVDCAFCDQWKVISLEADDLILEKCGQIQEKYTRAS